MPQPIATTIPDALSRLRDTIAGAGIYADAQVRVSLEREPHPSVGGGESCHVLPGPFRSRGWEDGGGRHVKLLDGTIPVRCYARRAVDPIPGDLRALASTSADAPGLLRRAQSVADLLDVEFLLDADGNHLTAEPLRLEGHGEPARYRVGREWVWVELRFAAALLVARS